MSLYRDRAERQPGSPLPATFGPSVNCPECGRGFPLRHQLFVDYFRGAQVQCGYCGSSFSLWASVVRSVTIMMDVGNVAIQTIANVTLAQVGIVVGGITTVDLRNYGVPNDPLLLNVFIFPGSEDGHMVDAVESWGRPTIRLRLPLSFDLHGVGWGGLALGTEATVDVRAQWVEVSLAPDAVHQLAQAVIAHGLSGYDRVVVPANVAVELTVERLLFSRGRAAGHSRRKVKKADYADRLAKLLPDVARSRNQPEMPAEVAAALLDADRWTDVTHKIDLLVP